MYKTVKHGENSLQYKILAQQEEGLTPHVKCKKSGRGKAVGIITLILFIIFGVIATSVLVPLLLTNDLVTLRGTFQKFSVSTLRRSHSGNHVVVIAKKPHGWNSSHQNVLKLPPKATNASIYNLNNKTKHTTTIEIEPFTYKNVFDTVKTTAKTTRIDSGVNLSIADKNMIVSTEATFKSTVTPLTLTTPALSPEENTQLQAKYTPLSISVSKEEDYRRVIIPHLHEVSSTEISPTWSQNRKWNFDAPASFIAWSKNRISNNPLSTTVTGILAVSVIIIMIIVVIKSLPGRKGFVERESPESKEDKTRLLKPSARASDEE